jgi:hypothetical protein
MAIDRYKHLNDGRDGAVIGIEEMAHQVCHLNYGVHRMLSAIVRIRLAEFPGDRMATQLKKLLEDDINGSIF